MNCEDVSGGSSLPMGPADHVTNRIWSFDPCNSRHFGPLRPEYGGSLRRGRERIVRKSPAGAPSLWGQRRPRQLHRSHSSRRCHGRTTGSTGPTGPRPGKSHRSHTVYRARECHRSQKAPQVAQVPRVSQASQVSQAPPAPQVAQVGEVPQVTQAPQAPQAPQVLQVPQVP